MDYITFIWLAIVIIFALVEINTITFYSLCFSIAGLVALIFNLFNASLITQLFVFVIVLAITLIFVVPFMRKTLKIKVNDPNQSIPTNLDLVIGKEGVCSEKIKLHHQGAVKVGGKEWTAIVDSDENINEGDVVIVKRIDGVKVVVTKKGA
ncbi:MAG: NfeD family protein [Bacilli bacterium]|jgi:membrane protein implicated in regulation of membrane protease activity|nr:NfeD family protein [Bacilli bacterium]